MKKPSATQRLRDQALALYQNGHTDQAIHQLQMVLSVNAHDAEAIIHLAEMLRGKGHLDEALSLLNKAPVKAPNAQHARIFNGKGLVYLDGGQAGIAEIEFSKALAKDSGYVPALTNLLTSLRQQGKTEQALTQAGTFQALVDAHPELLNNLGSIHFDVGDFSHALSIFQRALALKPDYLTAQLNVAKSYLALDQVEEGLNYITREINLSIAGPTFLKAVLSRCESTTHLAAFCALVLAIAKQADATTVSQVLILDSGPAWVLKTSNFLVGSGRSADARDLFSRLKTIAPKDLAVLNNFGSYLFAHHFYPESQILFDELTTLYPTQSLAWRNLGSCNSILGNKKQALECYLKAWELNPVDQPSLVLSMDLQLHLAQWDQFYERCEKLVDLMKTPGPDLVGSLQLLPLTESAATQRDFLEKAAPLFFGQVDSVATLLAASPVASPQAVTGRRLRVGYLSFDFRNHPVSYLTSELFELHDRTQFEVVILSYGPEDDEGGYRPRIKAAADEFIDLKNSSALEMVQHIRAAQLDVLVDLTANTQHTRSAILAYRLAPVQMHWLGFMATMGSTHYDYIVSDPITSPPGFDDFFVEKLIRLPDTLQVNDRQRTFPTEVPTRASVGLPEDAVIFGNFTQAFKIQPRIFSSWMNILKRVPNSVFWMAISDPEVQDRLRQQAQAKGVSPDRLIFAARVGMQEYLSRYRLMDLLLDTYPIGSGTTASDCLWMGCPLLVAAGQLMYSRMAGGILHAVGLDALVTESLQDYEDKAVNLGLDPDQLRSIRQHLDRTRLTAPLFDTPRFVRFFETALVAAAHRARIGLPPTPITVQPDFTVTTP